MKIEVHGHFCVTRCLTFSPAFLVRRGIQGKEFNHDANLLIILGSIREVKLFHEANEVILDSAV